MARTCWTSENISTLLAANAAAAAAAAAAAVAAVATAVTAAVSGLPQNLVFLA